MRACPIAKGGDLFFHRLREGDGLRDVAVQITIPQLAILLKRIIERGNDDLFDLGTAKPVRPLGKATQIKAGGVTVPAGQVNGKDLLSLL